MNEQDAASQIEAQPSNIWETANEMINGFLAVLPKLAIALPRDDA